MTLIFHMILTLIINFISLISLIFSGLLLDVLCFLHAYIFFDHLLSPNIFITVDSSLPLYFALVRKLRPQVGLCDVFLFRSSLWTAWLVALGLLVRAKHILFFFLFLLFNLVVAEVGSPWTSRSAVGAHLKKKIPRDSITFLRTGVNNRPGNVASCFAN